MAMWGRGRRLFRVGSPNAGLERWLPLATARARRAERRSWLTLAQRRRIRRRESGLRWGSALVVALAAVVWFTPPTHALLIPAALSRPPVASPIPNTRTPPIIHYSLRNGSMWAYPDLRIYSGRGAPTVRARAAFLFDPQTGVLYYRKNANTVYPVAGLTKIMTLLLAMDAPSLDQPVTVGPDAAALANSQNSAMGLSAGERVSLRALLYGLVVSGGNDAALTIADAVGGDEPTFVALMNNQAAQLGLWRTHYASPDGADPGDVASASDLARLAALVMARPGAVSFTSVRTVSIAKTATHQAYKLVSDNNLLPGGNSPYPGAVGVRTGYTDSAGYCLAFAARDNGHLLVGVVLGDPTDQARLADAFALLNWGFAQE